MKRIWIVEDEQVAADHLKRQLHEVMPKARVEHTLQSIEESVECFREANQNGTLPDIVYMDIHLADGLAFDIFNQVEVRCPIVFTTAYDQYALEAFRQGGIDYLLKPISLDDLRRMGEKIDRLSKLGDAEPRPDYAAIGEGLRPHRSHYLLPIRDKLVSVDVQRIAYICVVDKMARIVLDDEKQYSVDRPLDALAEGLDPHRFFRANRQFVVCREAISEISVWPISKLAITLNVPTPERIIISKAKVNEFKQWYTT